MDTHLATWPDAERARYGRALAVALTGCALLSVVVWTLLPVTIRVEGIEMRVPSGTTASDLVREKLVAACPGDVLAVNGGVAAAHGGGPPIVMFDRVPVDADARVYPEADVTSTRGRDVGERAMDAWVAAYAPVRTSGSGPDVVVRQLGAAGLIRARIGEVSHAVLTTWSVETTPVPMIVERRPFPPGMRTVALTFDDGPWPGQTERVLEILAAESVKATFFMNGVRVRMQPAIARLVVVGGHVIGNHTQTHLRLGRATAAQVAYEMAAGKATIKRYTGVDTAWFRAPGGTVTPAVRSEARVLGERVIGWTVDPKDWRKVPPDKLVRGVVRSVRPGAVVLLHDGGGDRSRTIAALPELIRQLKAMGYTFLTLDEMYPAP